MTESNLIFTGKGLTLTKYGAGFRVIRRGRFELINHLEGQEDYDPPPTELVVEIVLPGVKDPNTIDLNVTSKEVMVRYIPNHPETDFTISLPFKVNTKIDLQAKWIKGEEANLLQLTLPVIPEIRKYEPRPVFDMQPIDEPEETPNQDNSHIQEIPNTETQSQTKSKKKLKAEKPKDPIELQPQITVDEKVVTVVLYKPNLNADSLKIINQKFTIFDKSGQEYFGEFQTPFELHSTPKIQANSGFVRLFFIESEEKAEEEQQEEEVPILEGLLTIEQLENPFIFEIEP